MPSPAVLSLIALLLVVAASLTSRLNVGVLAIALATPVAIVGAGWKPDQIMATFPSSLFLTLTGVTLFFGVLQANGTMQTVTRASVRLLRGNAALLPLLLFTLACVISSLGPGSIATAALLAPLAMGIAHRAGVPLLLAALMIGNGVNAGNLSAISAIGVLVQELMTKAGLGGHAWETWSANFAAHALAAAIAWTLFGGPRLLRAGRILPDAGPPGAMPAASAAAAPDGHETTDGSRTHLLSLLVLALWMTAVVAFKVNPGLAGFAAASVLVLAGLGEDAAMLRQVPWAVLVMVCGVSVLIGVLEKTGGMELFTTLLSRLATPDTVNGVIAGVTGLISTYSSTAGVVYPAFLPAVPGLVAKLGGGNPLEIALSINVGAALVDVSPLSTIGSLCIAAVPAGVDSKPLFRALLLWGFAMTLVAALFCQLFIGLFAG